MTLQTRGQCARHPDRTTEAICPRCGNFTCVECNPDGRTMCPSCVERGHAANTAQRAPTPWERRDELGFVQSLVETWKRSVIEPQRFFPSVQPDGPLVDAVLYAWLIQSVAAVTQFPFLWFNLMNIGQNLPMLGDKPELKPFLELLEQVRGMPLLVALALTVVTLMFAPVGLFIGAGLVHLGGLLFGASKHGFNATVRAVAYSLGPNVAAAVPCVGGLAAMYTLVLEVWAVKELQESSWGRAAASVLWILAVLCCCIGAGTMLLGLALANKFGN
ncbi:MAG: YIP1 family protein [Archangium sp.]|nr:YIP1 family protein [Archangium sp.]